ncbi:hypothetical protein UPYG_G00332310 [Umbra pygmaea]|uniref:Raftlin n=1 Tax=Umbra pygmaea TaxID=75934 RepID=A0ABD0WDT4_UMBPY
MSASLPVCSLMGCRLPKLRRAGDEQSPGKIYSTLRRPQVETKVGVAYTYHYLDFLLGKEEVSVSSVLCLSSVRELPVQVRELYAQGFVLVAVHPFVHPCGPQPARIQRQLHRAVLVKETDSAEKTELKWARRRLETDVCVSGQQSPDPEVIQNYVKKIQDMSEQGELFVAFLQQPGGGPCFLGHWEPEDLSSLHSSPSPIHRHPASTTASPLEPSILDLIHTEPRQNSFKPEYDHEAEVKTQNTSTELKRVERNAAEAHEVELDVIKIQRTDISPQVAITQPSDGDHSPVRKELQPNLSPNESLERLQSDSLTNPTSDQPNPVQAPAVHPGDQARRTSTYPADTTCPERPEHETHADFIRTLLPNYSPPELQGRGSPDPGGQSQAARQSPHPQTPNQRQTPEQDRRAEDAVSSPEQGSKFGPERGCRHGNRRTGGDRCEHQRGSCMVNLLTHKNNNHIQVERSDREKEEVVSPADQRRVQLFALYNHMGELSSSMRFYSLRVPLRLQREAGLVTEVDAHWLDHMTQHFTSGACLIDGFFHLGDNNANGIFSVDSVFIFQCPSDEATPTSYDAIVVEQWTIVDGVVVRTDYIPLLQSLAPYGWRLMCVLPTPIVRTNSDGSLSTKQILFLQRPALQRKRKDFKKLNLRGWNKAKKNSAEEMLEMKESKNASLVMERKMDGEKRSREVEEMEERKNCETNRNESIMNTEEEREPQEDFPQATKGWATVPNQEVKQGNSKVLLSSEEGSNVADISQNLDTVKLEKKRALFSGVC